MSEYKLKVQRRDDFGKNVNRRLRAAGEVPAVVYGGDVETVPVSVSDRQMQAHLRSGGENAIFLLQLDGSSEQRHAMIRDLQVDPRNGKLVHIDFYRVAMDEVVRVNVPIELSGTPIGVRRDGGMIDFPTREVEVECLPTAIPSSITVDVSAMTIGDHIEASALQLGDGVVLTDEPTRVIVSVSMPRIEEPAADEEAEEAAEPEVIGERDEEQGEDDD
ncbi:MAG: 50S ribosomal protein L25 [Acidobacteria bacterium]|nr:MAG: 50S ribosomal protein L25 [Acidobacteriota bacterium]REK10428.1 MAG: 50S ribosomal protein L25 [Acidobacteriota bacterium]